MTTTDLRTHGAASGGAGGNGLSPAARTSARARLSAMELSDEFDSLTELFLGEVGTPQSSPRSVVAPAPSPIVHDPLASAPEAPSQPAHSARSQHIAASHDSSDDAHSPPSPRVLIETLVIGHVPVFASAWSSQYVREVVRASARPAAFVRIHDDHATLDIVLPVDWNGVPPDQSQSIDDAIRDAASITSRWIIQTDAVGESDLAADPGVSLITLLTSADEAARVAGYGAVKRLSEHLPPAGSDLQHHAPQIRVATVGVAPEVAGAAGQKIVEAVRHFLGRDAQQAVCSPKIRAGRASILAFSGAIGISAREVVKRIAEQFIAASPAKSGREIPQSQRIETPAPPQPEAIESDAELHATPLDHSSASAPASSHAAPAAPSMITSPEPIATSTHEHFADRDVPAPTSRVSQVAPEPQPMPRDAAPSEPAQPGGTRTRHSQPTAALTSEHLDSLCENIEGLVRLGASCPAAAGVELALDADGQLHVIADGRGGEWRVNGAIADAMVAASWLQSHVHLVAPLAASLRAASRATLHVMVDQPRQARRLLDSGVKFHLLAEVRVGDAAALYCTDLN